MSFRECLLAIVVIFVVISMCIPERFKGSTRLINDRDKKILPEITTDMVCIPHDGKTAIVIPLVSDENNIFNVTLLINGYQVQAAVDTGSEALVISGEDCDRCKSNGNQGQIPMPEDPIHISTMRYGSQSDSVMWDIRPVSLRGWKVTCDEADDDSALTIMDKAEHDPICLVENVSLAVVESRTGTSNYNVLGLGAQTSMGPPSFLSSIFSELPRAFSIYIQDYDNARLILYKPTPSCNPPRHLFQIDRGNLQSHQYLLNFSSLLVNNTDSQLDVTPYRLMMDTGANAISLPGEIFDYLDKYARQGKMTLMLTNIQRKPVKLNFNYDMDNRYNAQILNAGYSEKLIVGVTFMAGLGLGIYESENGEKYISIDW